MATLLVRHKVEDFAKWKAVYDEAATESLRNASGVKAHRVLRNADSPNEVIVLHEYDDLAKARQFAQSDELKQIMQRAGVSDHPDIYFLDEV